ncbi:hypothetical protein MNBD_PLANCTO02-955, partial [hydrothermal vent metagenome]
MPDFNECSPQCLLCHPLASLNKLLSDLMGSTDEVCVVQQQDAFVKSD